MVGSTALIAGAVIGIRHALETDHLAAIATLVEEDTDRPSFVGASWGIGHSLPIAVLGLLFVRLGIRLPEAVTQLFEVIVGFILIYLGGRMLWTIASDVTSHDHGHGTHRHFHIGDLSLGASHTHLDDESFLVGIIHGFAGSGALVIALVSTAPTIGAAVSFLVAFSALSVLTMAGISYVWGQTLDTPVTAYLKGIAGLLGVGIGVTLLTEQVATIGVF